MLSASLVDSNILRKLPNYNRTFAAGNHFVFMLQSAIFSKNKMLCTTLINLCRKFQSDLLSSEIPKSFLMSCAFSDLLYFNVDISRFEIKKAHAQDRNLSLAFFSPGRKKFCDTVAFSFVCGNYCLTMD